MTASVLCVSSSCYVVHTFVSVEVAGIDNANGRPSDGSRVLASGLALVLPVSSFSRRRCCAPGALISGTRGSSRVTRQPPSVRPPPSPTLS